jgi:hypothetical protein
VAEESLRSEEREWENAKKSEEKGGAASQPVSQSGGQAGVRDCKLQH